MRGLVGFSLAVAALGAGAMPVTPAAAQGSYSPFDESPAAALARYVRTLASDPKDFDALIGAGKAALELGDAQAAAGFFARADEQDSRSPLPQAGMGAVSVANGDPQAALPYFKHAQQLGASVASFACDRGLAYDLLGKQAQAQADYRLALAGRDGDEARRRLALSLAISGDQGAALQILAPLAAKGDSGVPRVRAFVLALTGDANSAIRAINAVMPGASTGVAPLLQRLPQLSAAQKAAAVNFGIFPDSAAASYAYAGQARGAPPAATASTDRLSDIDALLNGGTQAEAASARQPLQQRESVQVAYSRPPVSVTGQRTIAPFQPKIWLQLASGQDVDDLSSRFRRLKSKSPDVFDGIKPYVARSADRARLLVGPFHGASDAAIFAQDLETIGVDAFKFTNSPSDRIAPLPVE